MIESLEDLKDVAATLDEAGTLGVNGRAEVKAVVSDEVDVHKWKEAARNHGFVPEEETHELEGRHMLTLTWHF